MDALQIRKKSLPFRDGCFAKMACVPVFAFFWVGLGIIGLANAEMLIYPAKGQSQEQQQKDEFECHQWAVQQTGYDPTRAQQAPQQQTTQQGGAVRGAAGGALLGAGIGAIAGDTGKGAAIGAGAGAVAGGARQRRQRQQQEAANQQAQEQQRPRSVVTTRQKVSASKGEGIP